MKRDFTFGKDLRELPIVCQDRGSYWHYSEEMDIYYRVYPSGNYSLIMGKYLPDPKELLENRPDKAPTKATVALWEHHSKIVFAQP